MYVLPFVCTHGINRLPPDVHSWELTLVFLYTCVRASWIEFINCPTRCDLFSLLHFCRQRILLVAVIQGGAKRTHVPWPPRSPDLSACDFFLWGYLKSKVYVRKPRTVDELKVSIREEIAIVPQEMLVNVMQTFEERLQTCVRQEGRHLFDIIFRNWVINVRHQNCIYYRLFWCWHNSFILKINKVTIIWKNMRSFCAIRYDIFINCNWVVTRWQWLFYMYTKHEISYY